jgi:fructoselysine-6-P-deglycase FrlB-like protein
MSFVSDEITSQPDTWARAAAMADDPAVRAALPEQGERVAIVGCGTSLYMAQSCAALRESSGAGESDAFPASEFPTGRSYDRVIALTRSGTTTEVIRLLGQLPAGQRSTVVTTDARHPAAQQASDVVILDFADEHSVVQTRFATSALALWRAALGVELGPALSEVTAELARPLAADLLARRQFSFLGTGWTVGLANEAALKLREAAQVWAESYPAMEFRHGPISVVDARSAVWIFGAVPDGLRSEIARTGAEVIHSDIDPMAHLTSAQRVAVALAERKGLDPDTPRGLTRSIVLSA